MEEYFIEVIWTSNLSVDKQSFIATQPYSFIYILSAAAFTCQNNGADSNFDREPVVHTA